MRQAIHIFRKDARHCWPYIAAVLALTGVNAWLASLVSGDLQNFGLNPARLLLALLIVLAWWFAIGAAVHGESLTGDRQFWTTRPYSWKSLLAAKFLFIVAFLGAPLFLSDCIILLASGYNPLTLPAGLLVRQCWLLGFVILPFGLAALTRATREFALVGVVFYVIAYVTVAALSIQSSSGYGVVFFRRASWFWDTAPWLLPAAGFSLLVWQYARRRTILVRVLAVALGIAAPFVMAGAMGRMAPSYRPAVQDDPKYRSVTVQLAADPGQANPVIVDRLINPLIRITVKFGGWPRDLMTWRLLRVTATAPEAGSRVWDSGEQPRLSMSTTSDGRDLMWLPLTLPSQMWIPAAAPSNRVDLSLSMALDLYEHLDSAALRRDGSWTHVPGFGNVRWLEDARGAHLVWRTALKPGAPGWTYSLSDGGSGRVSYAAWPGMWTGWSASPAWFAMSPVYSYGTSGVTVVHASPETSGARARMAPLLVFTAKRLVATLPRELKVPNILAAEHESK